MSTRAWKKQQAAIAAEAEFIRLKEEVVKPMPKKPKMPDGFREVLMEKGQLEGWLQTLQKHPVVVSIDLIDNEWVYTVRGINCPLGHWNDTPIRHVRGGSSNVWTPTKSLS